MLFQSLLPLPLQCLGIRIDMHILDPSRSYVMRLDDSSDSELPPPPRPAPAPLVPAEVALLAYNAGAVARMLEGTMPSLEDVEIRFERGRERGGRSVGRFVRGTARRMEEREWDK